jgi:hypothetical protein
LGVAGEVLGGSIAFGVDFVALEEVEVREAEVLIRISMDAEACTTRASFVTLPFRKQGDFSSSESNVIRFRLMASATRYCCITSSFRQLPNAVK